MGQVLIRNVSDRALGTFRDRARLKGTSLEQELRDLIEKHAVYTPEERAAVACEIRSRTKGVAPSMTLDEIREGLE
jgi:antitoxin FitA